jgi:hypothetical protein
MLSNHGTFFDPWMIGALSPKPVHIMCNDDAFRSPSSARYLNAIGAYPKKKGATDFKAMKDTLRRLSGGWGIVIFPEGQTTWDGSSQLIYRGIEKLVRKAGVPLVIVKIKGNFLSRPWWAESWRKGRVELLRTVYTVEQIAAMDDQTLFEAIKNGITHNELTDADNLATTFSGTNLAQGLQRMVWQCLHCQSQDTIKTQGDTISCSHCGAQWRFDAHCRMHPLTTDCQPSDLYQWSRYQRDGVLAAISQAQEGTTLCEASEVLLQELLQGETQFVPKMSGRLSLTHQKLSFTPQDRDQPPIVYAIDDIKDYVVQKKDIFEIRIGERYLRFVCNGTSPMKWVYYFRYLNGYQHCEQRGYL